MDPFAGIIGACVIASWSYGLIRDAGAILLDRFPNRRLAEDLRTTIESDGSRLADLHLWRLGPGHLGAIVSVCPKVPCTADYYRAKLARYPRAFAPYDRESRMGVLTRRHQPIRGGERRVELGKGVH